ncbi:MAG: glycosyltransferase family 4 protein [Anaerolineales bacterium]|nr:glycosyltransferase family 4 protein [Anaerolineales bacterium]
MRILFVADGRSPIALNWIKHFVEAGYEVHLVSTFPCEPQLEFASCHVVPVAFSTAAGSPPEEVEPSRRDSFTAFGGKIIRALSTPRMRTRVRQWFGPRTLPKAVEQLKTIYAQVQPDLIHAMRIPFEGMLAAQAKPDAPLLISVWGNDFTLHGKSTPVMNRLTRKTLKRASALHTDCRRDADLALKWGFSKKKPVAVLPGAGGIQPDIFYPPTKGDAPVRPTIINPRGFRAYVRNDTFFKAIPRVLEHQRDALFLCPNMAGEAEAESWVERLGIEAAVELLPRQPRNQMAELFRSSQIVVSPSTHDGTPNTLLEALACGCFPIAGDIQSIREWVTPGENGLLVDPGNARELADAIINAIINADLRAHARKRNLKMVKKHATYKVVMKEAEKFYAKIVEQ